MNPGNVFNMPQSVFIEPNKYLVICKDTVSFKLKFPGVKNFIGNINFSLNNGGEHIQLLDDQNEIVDSLTYDDIDPWPSQPDGTGPTLALINPGSDNSLPQNWEPSIVDFGTPGNPNDQPLSVDEQDNVIPAEFVLYANYPNPFNPTTNFGFRIANFGFVSLKIYDVLGDEVATLVNGEKPAGRYTINFNAAGLAAGVYFYQLKADGFAETKKLILLK
jgi:hypothetical protein